MKKISNLVLSLAFITTPLFSQSTLLDSKFENIKEEISPLSIKFKFDYDVNGDSITDFSTISVFEKDSLGNLKFPKAPLYYIFYTNETGTNEIKEIIYDEKRDGINDNEEIYYRKPKKPKSTKIIL